MNNVMVQSDAVITTDILTTIEWFQREGAVQTAAELLEVFHAMEEGYTGDDKERLCKIIFRTRSLMYTLLPEDDDEDTDEDDDDDDDE